MRHAGIGWPNGPADNARILALPSPGLLMLGSEHWHYDEAVRSGKRVLFRGMARQGFRPAEVGWNARRYVDEITRDAVRVAEPITDFVGWNELNLQDERGDRWDDHGDLTSLFSLVGQFLLGVISELRQRPVTQRARLHFGAWAPKDETDYTEHWQTAAERCDVMDVHAYGAGPGILGHISKYRALFPGKPIELTEWHSNLNGLVMDRDTLALLANYAAVHQDFRAYYFMWKWHNPPGDKRDLADAIAIEGKPGRLALFQNPPVAVVPEPVPVPTPEPPPAPEPEPIPMPPALDPWQHWTAAQIAAATLCPVDAVTAHWPRILEQMRLCGFIDRPTQVAMLGTVAIETAHTFEPVREAFWLDEAWRQANLRYYPHYGRGFIQLTWDGNYAAYNGKLDELWGEGAPDISANPDLALDPDVAAAVAALYFRDHGGDLGQMIPEAARRGDWTEVRRLVQGGSAGLDELVRIAALLDGQPAAPRRVVFNPAEPPHPQEDDFDCSQESLEWGLYSVGRSPAEDWLEPTMIREQVMSEARGLLDATGAGLAAFVNRHYGEYGFVASNTAWVTYDQVVAEAGLYPVLIGGMGWNHWSGVRGYDAGVGLLLANPAAGWHGIQQTMYRQQFDSLGQFAMVRITHPDMAAVPVPVPTPPPAEANPLEPWIVAVAHMADAIGDEILAEAGEARLVAEALERLVGEMQKIRTERVGPRP